MDIKILDSWLREYLETPAPPEEIARCLSLSSQSVEKVIPVGKNDFLYEIEVTSNRQDAFSVYGIARELSAVLPRYGIKAKLLPIPGIEKEMPKVKLPLPLEVTITQSSLVPRFTALIFDDVKIKPSPPVGKQRLELSNIRALNNVIDISNYLMLELGQPMHTFDYDKILKASLIVRQSKPGEKIVTLDGAERDLPPGTIIIEDGKGRIIDLCGIMGGQNSEVDEKTKRVLLFIQTYDPISIRKSCQALSFRTEAASRFEKGLDPEGVMLAMKRAIGLFTDWAEAKAASNVYDIYPHPPKPYSVKLEKKKIARLLGIDLELQEVKKILVSLGFKIVIKNDSILAEIPHWRYGDVSLPEDLIEEVARIYGYHNLPNNLPPISYPQPILPIFSFENQLKLALKSWGFTETPTYSMVSEVLLKKAGISSEGLLKIANPLSEDWHFLRTSLIPSLLEVILKNSNYPKISIFEISHVYLARDKNKLPEEKPKLVGLMTGEDYLFGKGVVEGLLNNFGITANYQQTNSGALLFNKIKTADIIVNQKNVGLVGEISHTSLNLFGINNEVAFFELDLNLLVEKIVPVKVYSPIAKYPPVIEDLALIFPPETRVAAVSQAIQAVSPLITTVELLDSYENTRTFRITYQSLARNLSDKDILPVREKIISHLEKRGVKLKK